MNNKKKKNHINCASEMLKQFPIKVRGESDSQNIYNQQRQNSNFDS